VRVAVLSCLGLGDGLISLVLSHNLQANGFEVTTFHPSLKALQGWFPHLPMQPLAQLRLEDLSGYDRIFLFHEKTPRMLEIQQYCQKQMADKITILNPIATLGRDYPFWEEGRFDGSKPFVDNLITFCSDVLALPQSTKDNGIRVPQGVQLHRYPKRVVIHPTSSRPSKNWPWERFERLASQLEQEGWEPHFLLTNEEKAVCPKSQRSPELCNLSEMAAFVAESGAMVGNDSGIGHLASCLGLPTVTICRNRQVSLFWRPAWAPGKVLFPPAWIPNLKGMRWRDRYWQFFIPTQAVLKAFRSLGSVA